MKSICLVILGLTVSSNTFADQNININTTNSTPSTTQSSQENQSNTPLPEGTYNYSTGNSSGTVVTTGEKKPYIVDNPNATSPVIQPYVYAQPPLPTRAK